MNEFDLSIIKAQLQEILDGEMDVTYFDPDAICISPAVEFDVQMSGSGKGRIDFYRVLPGLDAAFGWACASEAHFQQQVSQKVLEIFYCHRGIITWDMENGREIFLGPGEMLIHTMSKNTSSHFLFPTGYAETFSFSLAEECFQDLMPEFLSEIHFSPTQLLKKIDTKEPKVIASHPMRTCFFRQLFAADIKTRFPYLKLKMQEMLWQLDYFSSLPDALPTCYAHHADIVRELHADLTTHLSEKITISDLIKNYPIDMNTFQIVFKALYGAPVGVYMRRYRMEQACLFLAKSDKSIDEIASAVGYRSRSKFSQTFKSATGETPTKYRQRIRGEQ